MKYLAFVLLEVQLISNKRKQFVEKKQQATVIVIHHIIIEKTYPV